LARGKESLELELSRRDATSDEARRGVPSPPGPNKSSSVWLSLGALVLAGGIIAVWRAMR
jgi:hypothetical protein